MQRTQSIRRLLLVGAKGVSQQVHARFHIVVARIPNLAAFAVPVLFGALPVDVFAFGGHNDGALRIKKGLNPGDSHVSFNHIRAHFQKFMHSFLHATVVSSLGNGNGSVDDEKDGVRSIHTQRVILQEVGRSIVNPKTGIGRHFLCLYKLQFTAQRLDQSIRTHVYRPAVAPPLASATSGAPPHTRVAAVMAADAVRLSRIQRRRLLVVETRSSGLENNSPFGGPTASFTTVSRQPLFFSVFKGRAGVNADAPAALKITKEQQANDTKAGESIIPF